MPQARGKDCVTDGGSLKLSRMTGAVTEGDEKTLGTARQADRASDRFDDRAAAHFYSAFSEKTCADHEGRSVGCGGKI